MSTEYIKDYKPRKKMGPKTHAENMELSEDIKLDDLPRKEDGSPCQVPLLNLCIVSPIKASDYMGESKAIIRPEMAKEADDYLCSIGRIEAVGEFFYASALLKTAKIIPQVGDFVEWDPHAADRFEVNGMMFLRIKDSNILGIVYPGEFRYKIYA